MAKAAGIDPIHFGVVVIMNLSIGTFTPPFGINIFVGKAEGRPSHPEPSSPPRRRGPKVHIVVPAEERHPRVA